MQNDSVLHHMRYIYWSVRLDGMVAEEAGGKDIHSDKHAKAYRSSLQDRGAYHGLSDWGQQS